MKRITLHLTTELGFHDPGDLTITEKNPAFMERYRSSVEAELRKLYPDAEIDVSFQEFNKVQVEGFENNDKEQMRVWRTADRIFGYDYIY